MYGVLFEIKCLALTQLSAIGYIHQTSDIDALMSNIYVGPSKLIGSLMIGSFLLACHKLS